VALFYDRQARRLGPMLRGHVLLFERREAPEYSAGAGLRLLILFVALEFAVGPRMHGLAALGQTPPAEGVRTLILLVVLLAAVKAVGVNWADIGFLPPGQWRAAEWAYLAQILLIAAIVFGVRFGARLGLSTAAPPGWMALAAYVATQMLWGLYQEAVYRGVLQTELSRRFGALPGALVANIAFTFGPLHFYYLQRMNDPAATAIMLGSIFLIGVLFAFIFARTRNAGLVGLMHGVGNVFGNIGVLLGG
jgi:membrane protease YdiL (CAAX protease family)